MTAMEALRRNLPSTKEPSTESLRSILHREQASQGKPSPRSSPAMAMSPLTSWKIAVVLGCVDQLFEPCSVRVDDDESCDGQTRRGVNWLTRKPFSMPSTRQTKYDTAVPAGRKPWVVNLHRQVAKEVAGYGLLNPDSHPPCANWWMRSLLTLSSSRKRRESFVMRERLS